MLRDKWEIIILTDKKVYRLALRKKLVYVLSGLFVIFIVVITLQFIFFSKVYVKAMEAEHLRRRNEYLEEQHRKIIALKKEIDEIERFRKRIYLMLGVNKSLDVFEFVKYSRGDGVEVDFEQGCILPVDGEISLSYSNVHKGVDIVAPVNSPVKVIFDGIVKKVAYSEDLGNYVVVSHIDGYESVYAHLEYITVREGQHLTKGEIIGYVGKTGHTSGPHLHFELWKNGNPVNPLKIFKIKKR